MDNNERISGIVQRVKEEIVEDIRADVVPASVADFSELHDYVDANTYGGLCDDNADLGNDVVAKVQDQVDEWIKAGGPADDLDEPPTDMHADDCAFERDSSQACDCKGYDY